MAKRQLKYVGHSVPRVDGVEKVTGKAKFVGDLVVPGMLYGKILRSPYPHARIRAIDAPQAEALPGVVAVLTAADIVDFNPIYNGRPVIAMNKVRYVGEPVAAVAATDLATAEEALSLIQVDYEELPAAIGIEAALKKDAPLIHEEKGGNIGTHEQVNRGDVDAGFAQSDVVVEDTFTFPMVYHYAMEPHSVIAHYDDNDEVTVWSSAQHPFQVRGDIAKIFQSADGQGAHDHQLSGRRLRQQIVHQVRAAGGRAGAQGETAGAHLQFRRRIDGDGAPPRRAGADQDRRQERRHDHGARGGDLSRHRRLRRQRAAGDGALGDADARPLLDSQHPHRRLSGLHQYRFGGLVPRHRRAAGDLRGRIADRDCSPRSSAWTRRSCA